MDDPHRPSHRHGEKKQRVSSSTSPTSRQMYPSHRSSSHSPSHRTSRTNSPPLHAQINADTFRFGHSSGLNSAHPGDSLHSAFHQTTPHNRIISNIPGYFVVFVFDEPDILISDVPAMHKQRILQTSSLIPVTDPRFHDVYNDVFPPTQSVSTTPSKVVEAPRGFFTILPGETALQFKERVFLESLKSQAFRRFWRRHTDCPIPLNADGSPDKDAVKFFLNDMAPLKSEQTHTKSITPSIKRGQSMASPLHKSSVTPNMPLEPTSISPSLVYAGHPDSKQAHSSLNTNIPVTLPPANASNSLTIYGTKQPHHNPLSYSTGAIEKNPVVAHAVDSPPLLIKSHTIRTPRLSRDLSLSRQRSLNHLKHRSIKIPTFVEPPLPDFATPSSSPPYFQRLDPTLYEHRPTNLLVPDDFHLLLFKTHSLPPCAPGFDINRFKPNFVDPYAQNQDLSDVGSEDNDHSITSSQQANVSDETALEKLNVVDSWTIQQKEFSVDTIVTQHPPYDPFQQQRCPNPSSLAMFFPGFFPSYKPDEFCLPRPYLSANPPNALDRFEDDDLVHSGFNRAWPLNLNDLGDFCHLNNLQYPPGVGDGIAFTNCEDTTNLHSFFISNADSSFTDPGRDSYGMHREIHRVPSPYFDGVSAGISQTGIPPRSTRGEVDLFSEYERHPIFIAAFCVPGKVHLFQTQTQVDPTSTISQTSAHPSVTPPPHPLIQNMTETPHITPTITSPPGGMIKIDKQISDLFPYNPHPASTFTAILTLGRRISAQLTFPSDMDFITVLRNLALFTRPSSKSPPNPLKENDINGVIVGWGGEGKLEGRISNHTSLPTEKAYQPGEEKNMGDVRDEQNDSEDETQRVEDIYETETRKRVGEVWLSKDHSPHRSAQSLVTPSNPPHVVFPPLTTPTIAQTTNTVLNTIQSTNLTHTEIVRFSRFVSSFMKHKADAPFSIHTAALMRGEFGRWVRRVTKSVIRERRMRLIQEKTARIAKELRKLRRKRREEKKKGENGKKEEGMLKDEPIASPSFELPEPKESELGTPTIPTQTASSLAAVHSFIQKTDSARNRRRKERERQIRKLNVVVLHDRWKEAIGEARSGEKRRRSDKRLLIETLSPHLSSSGILSEQKQDWLEAEGRRILKSFQIGKLSPGTLQTTLEQEMERERQREEDLYEPALPLSSLHPADTNTTSISSPSTVLSASQLDPPNSDPLNPISMPFPSSLPSSQSLTTNHSKHSTELPMFDPADNSMDNELRQEAGVEFVWQQVREELEEDGFFGDEFSNEGAEKEIANLEKRMLKARELLESDDEMGDKPRKRVFGERIEPGPTNQTDSHNDSDVADWNLDKSSEVSNDEGEDDSAVFSRLWRFQRQERQKRKKFRKPNRMNKYSAIEKYEDRTDTLFAIAFRYLADLKRREDDMSDTEQIKVAQLPAVPPRLLLPIHKHPSPIIPCNHNCGVTGFVQSWKLHYQVVSHSHPRYLPVLSPPKHKTANRYIEEKEKNGIPAPYDLLHPAQKSELDTRMNTNPENAICDEQTTDQSEHSESALVPSSALFTNHHHRLRVSRRMFVCSSPQPAILPTLNFHPSLPTFRFGFLRHPISLHTMKEPNPPPALVFPADEAGITITFVEQVRRMIFSKYQAESLTLNLHFSYEMVDSILSMAKTHYEKDRLSDSGEERGALREIEVICGAGWQDGQILSMSTDHKSFPDDGVEGEDGSLNGLITVGDIHGNLSSLRSALEIFDRIRDKHASRSKMVFLGDFVDRGNNSVEVILLLLLYRMAFPNRIYLLRGNHESYRSFDWGFNAELHEKFAVQFDNDRIMPYYNQYGRQTLPKHPLYVRFLDLFNSMPLAVLATITHIPPLPPILTHLRTHPSHLPPPILPPPLIQHRRILIAHGGFTAMLPSLNIKLELSGLPAFDYFQQCEDPQAKAYNFGHPRSRLQDIQHTTLWADPGDADLPNGNRCPYSLDTTRRFMAANRIDLMIRAHQFFPRGVSSAHENRVVTVFSCFDYCGPSEASVLIVKLGERSDNGVRFVGNQISEFVADQVLGKEKERREEATFQTKEQARYKKRLFYQEQIERRKDRTGEDTETDGTTPSNDEHSKPETLTSPDFKILHSPSAALSASGTMNAGLSVAMSPALTGRHWSNASNQHAQFISSVCESVGEPQGTVRGSAVLLVDVMQYGPTQQMELVLNDALPSSEVEFSDMEKGEKAKAEKREWRRSERERRMGEFEKRVVGRLRRRRDTRAILSSTNEGTAVLEKKVNEMKLVGGVEWMEEKIEAEECVGPAPADSDQFSDDLDDIESHPIPSPLITPNRRIAVPPARSPAHSPSPPPSPPMNAGIGMQGMTVMSGMGTGRITLQVAGDEPGISMSVEDALYDEIGSDDEDDAYAANMALLNP